MMRLALLLTLFTAFSSVALGCTCINPDGLSDKQYSERLAPLAAIFDGEVIEVGPEQTVRRNLRNGDTIEEVIREVTFTVTRTWKGPHQAQIVVQSDAVSSCRFIPEVGTKLTIKALFRYGTLGVALCSVADASERKRVQRLLGPGRAIPKIAKNKKAALVSSLSS